MAFIYKITNTVSGKCYIGETTCANPETRWVRHKETIRRGVGCPALRDAVNKYGIDVFRFEVIRTCSLEERFDVERATIKEYNSVAPRGYNILPGGAGGGFLGKKHSAETIEKIKKAGQKFRAENPGHFETYREKFVEALKKADIGSKVKASEAFRKACEEGRVGAADWKETKTEEEREAIKEKIRATMLTNDKHKNIMTEKLGKKIDQYSLDGTFIKTHDSVRAATRYIDVGSHGSILRALTSRTHTAHDYIWKTHEPKDNA